MRMKKHNELPHTSRVNEKIIEYWQKYGRERDLDKFMRLYSPAGSQRSSSAGANNSSEERRSCAAANATTTNSTNTNLAMKTLTTMTTTSMSGNSSCPCASRALCECDAKVLRRLFVEEAGDKRSASQLTSRSKEACHGMQPKTKSKCYSTLDLAHEKRGIIIPIIMEQQPKIGDNYVCASADELRTPQKLERTGLHFAPQTPESVVKTHKRLEWDSMADIGYKKSMSTSNISTLERSLLKELYNENPPSPDSPPPAKAHSSDTDLKLNPTPAPLASSTFVDRAVAQVKVPAATGNQRIDRSAQTSDTLKQQEQQFDLVEKSVQTSSQQFLMSTHQVHVDKSAQTTGKRALTSGRQIQASKSVQTSAQRRPRLIRSNSTQQEDTSAVPSPTYCGGLGTPSSFEYYSSRSTSTSNNGTQPLPRAARNNEAAYIAHVNEVLARRQVLAAQNNQQSTRTARSALVRNVAAASVEDKENQPSTTSSSVSAAPPVHSGDDHSSELDLGVQLLCSLVDAKSLSLAQKKQLIRDIAKRLSCSELTSSVSSSVYEFMRNSNKQSRTRPQKTPPTCTNHSSKGSSLQSSDTQRTGHTAADSDFVAKLEKVLNALHGTEAATLVQQAAATSSTNRTKKIDKVPNGGNLAPAKLAANEPQPSLAPEPAPAPVPVSRQLLSTAHTTSLQPKTTTSSKQRLGDNFTATTSPASTVSSSSREPTTQKVNITGKGVKKVNTSSCCSASDLEQASMRDWLNPLTQSEFEYEQKQRELAQQLRRKSEAKKMISADTTSDNDTDSERQTQLNWIESEILRLQSLRSLLSKEVEQLQISRGNEAKSTATVSIEAGSGEATYDSVHTTTGNDVEVIIEQTEELVIDMENRQKETRTHTREQHIVYDNPDVALLQQTKDTYVEHVEKLNTPKTPSPTDAPERALPKTPLSPKDTSALVPSPIAAMPTATTPQSPPPPPPIVKTLSLRSRMDTPTGVNSGDGGSESVCSFVKQRKRQFMEHYKNKKKEHLDSLLLKQRHQQEEREREREARRKQCLPPQQQQEVLHHHVYDAGHQHAHHAYCAVQHIVPYTCIIENGSGDGGMQPANVYYQIVPPHIKRKTITGDNVTNAAGNAISTTSAAATVAIDKETAVSKKSVSCQAQQAACSSTTASSMFCMSSDMSIPMGTHNSSEATTTTTTHQYDDVAVATATAMAGIGVQTGGSIKRTRPIYNTVARGALGGMHIMPTTTVYAGYNADPPSDNWASHVGQSRTACVQVRPRGIAYSIQFVGGKSSPTTKSSSNSDNDVGVVCPMLPNTQLTLQDHLQRARPKFCAQSKERKAILNQMQMLRNERRRELDEIVDNTSFRSLDRKLQHLPSAATSRVHVFSTKEMKAMTNKRCESLPEVVARQQRDREDRRRRGNRLLRDVFNRRLQRRVRNGKLSLNHSRTII